MLTDKYRPIKLEDIVGQKDITKSISNLIKEENIPSMLFVGPPGCGKTTIAWIIARERFPNSWKADMIEYNASDERGIAIVRNDIKPRAMSKGSKIIFLDEVDNMTHDAQAALRRIMEDAPNTIFILSANREHKLMDAIKSRCAIYRFNKISEDLIYQFLIDILKKENIKPIGEKEDIVKSLKALAKSVNGDLRSALNTLESVATSGKFNPEDVAMIEKPHHIHTAFNAALKGNIGHAKQLFEDAFLVGNYTDEQLLEEFFDAIDKADTTNEVKARLYIQLREIDDALARGGTPLIQFLGYLYFVYVAPHLKGVFNNEV